MENGSTYASADGNNPLEKRDSWCWKEQCRRQERAQLEAQAMIQNQNPNLKPSGPPFPKKGRHRTRLRDLVVRVCAHLWQQPRSQCNSNKPRMRTQRKESRSKDHFIEFHLCTHTYLSSNGFEYSVQIHVRCFIEKRKTRDVNLLKQ